MRYILTAAGFLFIVSVLYLVYAAVRAWVGRAHHPPTMKQVVSRAESALGEVHARRDESRRDVETADRFIHFGKADP